MPKRYLLENVYDAAIERVRLVFEHFERVYVSFSAGKDSGVLLHLALQVAREFGRAKVDALLVDLEAQYRQTIEFAERMMGRPDVEPHWVCLPLHLRNAVSQVQPHWICWDAEKREAWVRQLPSGPGVTSDPAAFPFFRKGMEFEEFVPEFGEWFAGGKRTACLVGIRTDESLNRFRTIRNEAKEAFRIGSKDIAWSTRTSEHVWNFYPLYDWRVEDLWTANGKFGWDYNRVYDAMHLAGLSLHQMRLCQPFGDDQRKGLWLYKLLEPDTWQRLVNRVEGANFGNRYSKSQSHTLGNFKVVLPDGHTYKSYAKFLLATMPPYLATHYRRKLLVFFKWWRKYRKCERHCPFMAELTAEGQVPDWRRGFPDSVNPKLESGGYKTASGRTARLPSWRRVVKVLLKNDYWCKGLSFSQTKREMERQLSLIARFADENRTDADTPL